MKQFSIIICFLICSDLLAQLPAFPGAEGAGKFASGGRGTQAIPTTVFEVTNLNDDNNPGSLRYAVTQNVPYRTIVFRISGTIHLNSKLSIKANTTIAGQTAPGDGICIADHPVVISGDNVVLRYIRIRMGDKNQNKGMVDGSGSDDALGNLGNKNIIIDHCSVSWSSDEVLTIYRGDSITLQWNVLSEPLNYSYHFEAGGTDYQEHGYIGIWGGRKASFHHNLLAHAKGRMPRFDGSRNLSPNTAGQENADFRNNVIYNWISYSTNGGEGGNYNLINNYYKYGPSTSTGNSSGIPIRYMIMNPSKSSSLPYPKLFLSGNYVDGSTTITQNNWRGVAMSGGSLADTNQSKVTSPFTIADITTHTAAEAYDLVLKHAGVILPNRDTLDERIVLNVQNRTGKVIDVQGGFPHGTPYAQTVSAWPTLQSAAAPTDTDKDGMPDAWETANGLNPGNAADRNGKAVNGYTNLENYLNSLASDAISFSGSLNNFSQVTGTPSAIQTYSVSGKNLTGNVTIKPAVGYEVSVDGNNWFANTNPLVLNHNNGILNTTTISVRLNASAAGTYTGVVQHIAYAGGNVDLPLNGTTSTATALQPVNAATGFSIYPNPVNAEITLQHPKASNTSIIKIFSVDGRLLFTKRCTTGSDKTLINTSSLPGGNYLLEYTDKKIKTVFHFIKAN